MKLTRWSLQKVHRKTNTSSFVVHGCCPSVCKQSFEPQDSIDSYCRLQLTHFRAQGGAHGVYMKSRRYWVRFSGLGTVAKPCS
jgi:hypothetical protein